MTRAVGLGALCCVLMLMAAGAAHADDGSALDKRLDRLDAELKDLRARVDHLGPSSAAREVKVVDPVFIGAGAAKHNSLSMDEASINCPRHSFVTAVQVLKTGNTVSQIRYACRGLE